MTIDSTVNMGVCLPGKEARVLQLARYSLWNNRQTAPVRDPLNGALRHVCERPRELGPVA
ncbi:hypothetical protein SAMN07250955_105157 [Arboricoccus pini]|uniref:Uncharacterized protein n=1 Tax=Arboricoccus pini TaxID=1963835 RepID=A0A212R3P3_9PROT|nr:hypothetical protein SAMN07250955_105157 [Arboricoccus pini]